MKKQRISSGYPSETTYGYSRAVRVADTVYVSGTTARDNDLKKGVLAQARSIISLIEAALLEAGATLDDVVRTVVYVRSMANADVVASVHAEAFGIAKPASTIVEVSQLSPAEALIEIEVTAVLAA